MSLLLIMLLIVLETSISTGGRLHKQRAKGKILGPAHSEVSHTE